MYFGGCPNDECYFRKAEASFSHISEITQQDKGDDNFSSKTFRLTLHSFKQVFLYETRKH